MHHLLAYLFILCLRSVVLETVRKKLVTIALAADFAIPLRIKGKFLIIALIYIYP